MGIRQLSDLITEEVPEAITSKTPDMYRGKVLAIDASIFIHQFHSAVPELTNRHGDEIRVLQGFFQRTVFMLQNEIKPLYVFDGIPPETKRLKGTKDGNVQCRRKGNPAPTPGSDKCKDLKTLLTYLGVPFVQAPSEAEATCAHLVVKELAWGAVTEDMDALPFNCPRLIRNLKAKKKTKAQEYNLPEILKRLHLSREQFVDLCILLGCDYTGKIRHVGKKKALTLIQQNQNMEGILQVIKPKDRIPSDFDYITARRLFLSPDVADVHHEDLKWAKPDDEKILQFLSREKHIKEHRVRNTLQKLHATRTPNLKKRKSKTTEAPAHKLTKITEFFPVRKSARPDKSTPGTHQTS